MYYLYTTFSEVRSVCSIIFLRNRSSDKLITFSILSSLHARLERLETQLDHRCSILERIEDRGSRIEDLGSSLDPRLERDCQLILARYCRCDACFTHLRALTDASKYTSDLCLYAFVIHCHRFALCCINLLCKTKKYPAKCQLNLSYFEKLAHFTNNFRKKEKL